LTLQTIIELHAAFNKIEFEEFYDIIKKTISGSEDYARNAWERFHAGPLGYCATRGPISQGEMLFALAVSKLPAVRKQAVGL
jgi:hypothetical protein